MRDFVEHYPESKVFESDNKTETNLYETDPNGCCEIFKVEPTRNALEYFDANCWVTGLRCTEGRTRTDYREIESRDKGLIKLNPILIWEEREVWQYLAMNNVKVNELYKEGYRSLGCAPCTAISTGDERSGRWVGSSKCGGECGIHTRPFKTTNLEKRSDIRRDNYMKVFDTKEVDWLVNVASTLFMTIMVLSMHTTSLMKSMVLWIHSHSN